MVNLDPQAEKFLQACNQMPPIHTMDPKAVRDMLSNAPRPAVKLDLVSKVENLMIPVSQEEEIKCRVYIPEGKVPSQYLFITMVEDGF